MARAGTDHRRRAGGRALDVLGEDDEIEFEIVGKKYVCSELRDHSFLIVI